MGLRLGTGQRWEEEAEEEEREGGLGGITAKGYRGVWDHIKRLVDEQTAASPISFSNHRLPRQGRGPAGLGWI